MAEQAHESVWDAIETSHDEAEEMKQRSALMLLLKNHIARTSLSQEQATKLFCVSPTRVQDLMQGKINRFELAELINMTTAASLNLALGDQACFAQALLSPPKPAPALERAFARRNKLLR